MAAAPPKPAAKAAPSPGPKKVKTGGMVLGVIGAVCAVMLMPTTILVVVGMLPTAVAYFVDTSRERALGPTVLCLNFSGVLPALLQLWQQGHTVDNALNTLMQPINMVFMLIPAAFGWLLFAYVPYLVIGFIRRKAEARMKSLEKYQQDLVGQWGDAVSGAKVETTTLPPSLDMKTLSA